MKRILVVGAGSIGERHLRCFRATERVTVGFVELQRELFEQMEERYPGAQGFPSLDAALRESWNAAVVATPAPLHVPMACEALRRGISVLIEKPLSAGLDGIDELLEASRRPGVVAGVAYVHRANPMLKEMRRALHSGRFGRPLQLVATTGHDFARARPAYRSTYFAQRESGGGAVQDALTHIINIGEWLIGGIDRVVADVAHRALPGVNVEDTAHVLARHGTVLASYSLNQYQAATENTVTVVCERGMARFEAHKTRWRFIETADVGWIESVPVILERDKLFTLQAHAFLDAVEGKDRVECTVEEAVGTLRVNLAILRSADSGAWVTV